MPDWRYATEPFGIEYAKSGRASCRKCKTKIDKDALRIAEIKDSPHFDGKMPLWHKVDCMFQKKRVPLTPDEILGFDEIRPEDQKDILARMAARGGGRSGASSSSAGAAAAGGGDADEAGSERVGSFRLEYAASSRSKCRVCQTTIKGPPTKKEIAAWKKKNKKRKKRGDDDGEDDEDEDEDEDGEGGDIEPLRKKGELRLAIMTQSESEHFEGLIPMWHKVDCWFKRKQKQFFAPSVAAFDGHECLDPADRADLERRIAEQRRKHGLDAGGDRGSGAQGTTDVIDLSDDTHVSSSAARKKAKVQAANQPHDADALALAHLALIKTLLEKSTAKALKAITQDGSTFARVLAALVEGGFGTVQSFAALTKDDLAAIAFLSPKAHAPILSVAKKVAKLKAPTEAHFPAASGAPSTREEQFEAQSAALWAWKDTLKALSAAEQKELLAHNGLSTSSGESRRIERLADALQFGVPGRCGNAICAKKNEANGGGCTLSLQDFGFKCRAMYDEFTPCSFVTQQPERRAVELPPKWITAYKAATKDSKDAPKLPKSVADYTYVPRTRLFRKPLPTTDATSQEHAAAEAAAVEEALADDIEAAAAACPTVAKRAVFVDVVVAVVGTDKKDVTKIKKAIKAGGGDVVSKVTGTIDCLVAADEEVIEADGEAVQMAHKTMVPVVGVDWVNECIARSKKLPVDEFTLVDNVFEYRASGLGRGTAGTFTGKSGMKSMARKSLQSGGSSFSGGGTKSMGGFSSSARKSTQGYAHTLAEDGMAKIRARNGVAVDPESQLDQNAHAEVYHELDKISGERRFYTASFMKTDVSKGQNSYYKLQVIKVLNDWHIFKAWGRLGAEQGGTITRGKLGEGPHKTTMTKSEAIEEFEKKFEDLGGYPFGTPESEMIGNVRPGRYVYVTIDHGHDDDKVRQLLEGKGGIEPGSKTKLPLPVQQLVQLVLNKEVLESAMVEMEVDLSKMPLGLLKKETILRAMGALRELEDKMRAAKGVTLNEQLALNNERIDPVRADDTDDDNEHGADNGSGTSRKRKGKSKAEPARSQSKPKKAKREPSSVQMSAEELQMSIVSASNRFYSTIPHDTGGLVPPVLNTMELVAEKIAMLQGLLDVEATTKVMNSGVDGVDYESIDPIDIKYKQLKCEITPLETDHAEYRVVEKYIRDSHGQTHPIKLDIQQIFQVQREGEEASFKQFEDTPNRKLLWHGSRLSNYGGILSQGLRIAPKEAPVTGYMFGKGVYFADSVSKSANYCFAENKKEPGLLLLCEVALGKEYERLKAEYVVPQGGSERNLQGAVELPEDCQSTKGCGKFCAEDWTEKLPGIMVPDSKLKMSPKNLMKVRGGSLLYNEYIVYDVSQVKVKYLVQLGITR